MTTNGEFVGKLLREGSGSVTLSDPRMVVASDKGMGFANGIAMTSDQDPKDATFYNIIFITRTNSEVVSAWIECTSLIAMPNKGVFTGV
jgi:hypothetical protein